MNRKLLILLPVIALTGCAKTNNLFNEMDYNYGDIRYFDNNYYTDWNGIDKLEINEDRQGIALDILSEDGISGLPSKYTDGKVWLSDEENNFGEAHCLSNNDKAFKNTGILSKLYDGRVRCEGLLTKSRVQLDKTGFATYFPKGLAEANYFAFACRGGTNLDTPHFFGSELEPMTFNFNLSFYIHVVNSKKYDKVSYKLTNIPVQCDNGGGTNLISFPLSQYELSGCVAMSLTWEATDSRLDEYNLTDDYTNKEKNHLAIMLYEVFFLDSIWY